MLKDYADLIGLCWIHNRQDFSGRCMALDTSVGLLSLRERAGVRCWWWMLNQCVDLIVPLVNP